MSESLLTLIIRAVISFAVVGAWIYLIVTGKPVEPMNPVIIALIAFWFGESVIAARFRASREKG